MIGLGLGFRLALGGGGVGDRSAVVMAALLTGGAWVATLLLATPRAAFLVSLGVVALFDLAALPPHDPPVYDAREPFFRTDQAIAAQAPIVPGPGGSQTQIQPMLVLLVEPVFPTSAAQPRFGLAGEVGSATLAWDCAFQRGRQQVALPLPSGSLSGSAVAVEVRLHLTGSPSRETDYLVVYASAPRGGLLASVVGAAELDAGATRCALR